MLGNVIKGSGRSEGNNRDILPPLVFWEEDKGGFRGQPVLSHNFNAIKPGKDNPGEGLYQPKQSVVPLKHLSSLPRNHITPC